MLTPHSLLSIVKRFCKKVLLHLFVFPIWPMDKEYVQALDADANKLGTERYCNICGYRFARFNVCNDRKPREVECPVCKSRERHRHLYIHICALFPFLKGKRFCILRQNQF